MDLFKYNIIIKRVKEKFESDIYNLRKINFIIIEKIYN
jgi:hypothetical protein